VFSVKNVKKVKID